MSALINTHLLNQDGHIPLPRILELSRKINLLNEQKAVCQEFLAFLSEIFIPQTIAIFVMQADEITLDIVSLGYQDMPETIAVTNSRLIQSVFELKSWQYSIKKFPEIQAMEMMRLYAKDCQNIISFPILSGSTCVAVVKIDISSIALDLTCSPTFWQSLELVSNLIANRLEDVSDQAQLVLVKIDRWFDAAQLAFNNWQDHNDIIAILNKLLQNLQKINPTLVLNWYFYLNENTALYHLIQCNRLQALEFVADVHYQDNSHIGSFFKLTDKNYQIYTQNDINENNLMPFSGQVKSSLCIKLELTERQLVYFAKHNRKPVVWVIDSSQTDFFQKYQDKFLKIAERLAQSYKNAYAKNTQSPVDERYLNKTQEIVEQLLQENTKESLIHFTLHKILEIASETNSVSYGEISVHNNNNLQLTIREVYGEQRKPNYRAAHPLMNSGLWQQCWLSKQMVVVNNCDDVNTLSLNNLPLDNTKSALCIPVFDRHHKMTAIFSLSSLKVNAFLNVQQGMVEWLVQAFTSQLQQIEARIKQNNPTNISTIDKRLNCIKEIIELFNQLGENSSINHDHELLLQQAIKIYFKRSRLRIFQRA